MKKHTFFISLFLLCFLVIAASCGSDAKQEKTESTAGLPSSRAIQSSSASSTATPSQTAAQTSAGANRTSWPEKEIEVKEGDVYEHVMALYEKRYPDVLKHVYNPSGLEPDPESFVTALEKDDYTTGLYADMNYFREKKYTLIVTQSDNKATVRVRDKEDKRVNDIELELKDGKPYLRKNMTDLKIELPGPAKILIQAVDAKAECLSSSHGEWVYSVPQLLCGQYLVSFKDTLLAVKDYPLKLPNTKTIRYKDIMDVIDAQLREDLVKPSEDLIAALLRPMMEQIKEDQRGKSMDAPGILLDDTQKDSFFKALKAFCLKNKPKSVAFVGSKNALTMHNYEMIDENSFAVKKKIMYNLTLDTKATPFSFNVLVTFQWQNGKLELTGIELSQ